jgi:hypothetical protein
MGNIWFCGIPGSRWSGIDLCLRRCVPCDRTDESDERTFFHKGNDDDGYEFQGHRGIYWGPGMGSGSSWDNLEHVGKEKILNEIHNEFTGEGYRVIKSHSFARHNNLDFIFDTFKGDYMVLVQRDPIKSFDWWSSIMSFESDVYPSYNEMYSDLDTMKNLLIEEDKYIMRFGTKHNLKWNLFNPITSFEGIPGYDLDLANIFKYNAHDDVYISIIQL